MEEKSIELIEQYTMGNVGYDELKVTLEAKAEATNTDELLALFDLAIQSLEMAFWRDEIKKIAREVN